MGSGRFLPDAFQGFQRHPADRDFSQFPFADGGLTDADFFGKFSLTQAELLPQGRDVPCQGPGSRCFGFHDGHPMAPVAGGQENKA